MEPMDISEDEDEVSQHLVQAATCVFAGLVELYHTKYIQKTPFLNSLHTGNVWVMELLQGNDQRFFRMFRMDKRVFYRLCCELQEKYEFVGSKRMNVFEILGMFLHIIGHGVVNRLAQERFQHSGETISRYFTYVLDIICSLAIDVMQPEDRKFKNTPPQILRDSRYMPHFKDCIGAIDGTHIRASIRPADQIPYIGRKGMPTQNIMAACNFDMQFIFACAGWEGSAHDTRIFLSAIRNPKWNFPHPPTGKYYLVDAGYPQMKGYLGPYKDNTYHLPDFRRIGGPRGPRQVFNYVHSSLRSVIERTFGVWKKKWKILRDIPNFPFDKQVKIVIATMTLHNYIRRYAESDKHFDKHGNENSTTINIEGDTQEEHYGGYDVGAREMEALRNSITTSLMNAM